MALKIPFTRAAFATDMKSKISGTNVTLAFDNIESTLIKVGVEAAELIGQTLYDKVCDGTAANTPAIPAEGETPEVPANAETALNAQAKDYLQRAILHFAMYHHTIFFVANIGNDGITQKKSENEAPLYKYQQEKLENKLITDAWFWMNQLIGLFNANTNKFADWKDSPAQKELSEIPLTAKDFKKWIGTGDEYFMLNAAGIVREVWNDCILSRYKTPEKTDDIARAVCYEVIARSCVRLAYYCLPEPIRMDINNELGKDHASQSDTYIREKVSEQYRTKATAYFSALDIQIQRKAQTEVQEFASKQIYVPRGVSESDSFGF